MHAATPDTPVAPITATPVPDGETPDTPYGSMPDAPTRLLQDAARLVHEVPPLRPLLDAFVPLLEARATLRDAAPGWVGPLPAPAQDASVKGIPLLSGIGFQDVTEHLPAALEQLLPVMEAAFPALAPELAALRQALASGDVDASALSAVAGGRTITLPSGISAEVLSFVASEAVRPFIERQARDLVPVLRAMPWARPVCPTCGGAPGFSRLQRERDDNEFITGHGGVRFLHCATCATEWRYKRVSCPGCGNEEPEQLGLLATRERPFERADTCDACKRYILCQDATEFINLPDATISVLAMLPLELQARQAGYLPLVPQPWSAG